MAVSLGKIGDESIALAYLRTYSEAADSNLVIWTNQAGTKSGVLTLSKTSQTNLPYDVTSITDIALGADSSLTVSYYGAGSKVPLIVQCQASIDQSNITLSACVSITSAIEKGRTLLVGDKGYLFDSDTNDFSICDYQKQGADKGIFVNCIASLAIKLADNQEIDTLGASNGSVYAHFIDPATIESAKGRFGQTLALNIQQTASGAVTFDVVDDSASNGLISLGNKSISTRANNSYQIYGFDAT